MTLVQRPQPISANQDRTVMPSVVEALHCLRVAITVFDSSERLVFANEHFTHLFRSLPPRQVLVGQKYADLIRLEIDGELDASAIGDVEDYIGERRSQLAQYRPRDLKLADGRIVEIKARRTIGNGTIILWTDVTAARRDMERLHTAIALSADAFAFYDPDDRLVLCNDEYAVSYGAAKSGEIVGKHFEELIRALPALGTVVMRGGPEAWIKQRLAVHREPAGAMTIETASGGAFLVRDRATADGGRIVVLSDITEHQRIEKALAEQTSTLDKTRHALAQSQAESSRQANYLADLATKLDRASAEANTTKTTLLRTMSHELKTPLNAIIGFSDLLDSLADRAAPEQIREYAGLIRQGGNNLLRLINQILDLTKISAGRFELHRHPVDAGALMWQAKDAADSRAAEKNIAIDAEACPAGLMADADEAVLTVMIGQLVENAVGFTQAGGMVRLTAERMGDTVRLAVCDNGPGVAAADLERILLPFEQGGRTTTDHHAGAGLGLTLVKAFAELHGGALAIASAPGEGFTATITLPVATR